MSRDVIYRINHRDEITFVNDEYDQFALVNGGAAFASKAVLGRPLWSFVIDETSRQIYSEAVRLVRGGRSIDFGFRCDSPARRRLMRMHMKCVENGAVEFRVRTIATEDRPAAALLRAGPASSEGFLTMCGWCKKLRIGEDWKEVEEATAALNLFEASAVPRLTHGICEACSEAMVAVLQ
ncbi:MAG: hypothetical protein ABR587_04990 [Candidatus Binatia bacterium]